jgi:hypothetical protein
MKLIQIGSQTFIPSDAKIVKVKSNPNYPEGIGTLTVVYDVPHNIRQQHEIIHLTEQEDKEIALRVFRKMAAQVVHTTPEIDFWVNVVNHK